MRRLFAIIGLKAWRVLWIDGLRHIGHDHMSGGCEGDTRGGHPQ